MIEDKDLCINISRFLTVSKSTSIVCDKDIVRWCVENTPRKYKLSVNIKNSFAVLYKWNITGKKSLQPYPTDQTFIYFKDVASMTLFKIRWM